MEVRPPWRWLLYGVALIFGGIITGAVGVALWANPRYRSMGRVTFYLSFASFFLIALAIVISSFFD